MIVPRLLLIASAIAGINVSAFRNQEPDREKSLRGTPPTRRSHPWKDTMERPQPKFHPLQSAIAKIQEEHPLKSAIEKIQEEHPFQTALETLQEEHPFENMMEAGKETLEKIHERVNAVRTKIQESRKQFVEKLADYQEGQLHFSWECAQQISPESCAEVNVDGEDGSSACSWCEYHGVVSFCISSQDEKQISSWGADLNCGGQGSVEEDEDEHDAYPSEEAVELELELDEAEEEELDEEDIKASLDFSTTCSTSRNSDSCKKALDEFQNSCAWCSVNSWIGVCVSLDEEDNAEALAMDCGSALM